MDFSTSSNQHNAISNDEITPSVIATSNQSSLSSNNTPTEGNVIQNNQSPNKNEIKPISTSPSKNEDGDQSNKPKKKKKPIQHLIAGGTAGFVESSVCHPLDTIKTRMQLRRQTTNRQVVRKNVEGVMGRALGSVRDADASMKSGGTTGEVNATSTTAKGSGAASKAEAAAKGALHRTAKETATVVVKPDLSSKASAAAASSTSEVKTAATSALHDVGWKQRVPPPSAAAKATTATTVSFAASSSSSSAMISAANAAKMGVVQAPLGPFGTARRIVQREGPLALYKGLTAVYTGIVPKMAIRFVSFEYYRDVLGGWYNRFLPPNGPSATAPPAAQGATPPAIPTVTFTAGLLSGLTEAIMIVTPAEVCKIRMQSQYHSLIDPSQKPQMNAKYKNVAQTAMLIVKEEGIGALYKGVVPTMLRQGCNQAVNFTAYNWSKKRVLAWKKQQMEEKHGGAGSVGNDVQLDHWQSLLLGGLSGGMGPLVNNPLDVVKTRMQKQVIHPGKEPKYKSLLQSCMVIAKEEGTPALWKGITPRLMRIMPGQAITFMTYEAVSARMESFGWFDYE